MFLETLINLIMIGVEYAWFDVTIKIRNSTIFPSVCYTGIITLKLIELHKDRRICFLCILNMHSQDGHHVFRVFLLSSVLFFKRKQNQKQ